MIKHLFIAFLFLALGVVTTQASEDTLSGKVVAVDGAQVKIAVTGALPVWAKKGGYLRATTADGKLILRGAKIMASEGNIITVTTTKAKEMTVGDTYVLGKGKASSGC